MSLQDWYWGQNEVLPLLLSSSQEKMFLSGKPKLQVKYKQVLSKQQ